MSRSYKLLAIELPIILIIRKKMLQSLITYGFLYSKSIDADKSPAVLQPLDEILEIPEAQALWGQKKKDKEEEVVAEEKATEEPEDVEEVEEEEEEVSESDEDESLERN